MLVRLAEWDIRTLTHAAWYASLDPDVLTGFCWAWAVTVDRRARRNPERRNRKRKETPSREIGKIESCFTELGYLLSGNLAGNPLDQIKN